MEEYEYGQPIPEKYRNRLFDWMGGGYSGCFEEPNAGLVDADGHWHPLYSTGTAGIDDGVWFERQVFDLKQSLGYDIRDAEVQYAEKVHDAILEVFGKKWYEIEGVCPEEDTRVIEKTKEEKKKLDTFRSEREKLLVERQKRLDQNFMMAFERSMEDDRPSEIGLLDNAHLKETCALFCANYKGNVGFMAHVLDKLATFGYAPWCTCSDCGGQFRLCEYEKFGHLIDPDAYHGDGGIGVIMTRIQCETCRSETTCAVCCEPSLPNTRSPDGGKSDFGNYGLLASVLYEWLEVCWGCASGFECDHLREWREDIHQRVETPLGEKFYEIEEDMKEKYREEKGHDLYEKMLLDVEGRKTINKIRDMLEKDAREEFEPSIGDEWFSGRICEKAPEQYDLPGMTEKQEEK